MNNRFVTSVEVQGQFVSPVHIGWGKELDPFNCFISEGYLYYFDLSSVLQRFSEMERSEFLELVDGNDLIGLRTFLKEKLDPKRDAKCRIAISSSVVREYEAKLQDPRNQLIFEPFFRNEHTFCPLIPGSSIKGAIRTAVIDTILERKGLSLYGEALHNPRKMEQAVLGHRVIDQDPFKAFKVQDVNLKPDSTIMFQIYNYSPLSKQLRDLGLRFETTRSSLEGHDLSFLTQFQFFDGYKGTQIVQREHTKETLSMFVTPGLVLEACRRFFTGNLEDEHDRFYKGKQYEDVSRSLLQIAKGLEADECLVRLGRFTQAESKSINRYRRVMVRTGRSSSKPMDFGTTRNLADGYYPMGWVKLKFFDFKADQPADATVPDEGRESLRGKRRGPEKHKGEPDRGDHVSKPVDLWVLKKKYKVKKDS